MSKGTLADYDSVVKACRDLVVAKGEKYHGQEDILTTFRLSSGIARLEPAQTMIVRIVEKMMRVGNMVELIQKGQIDDALKEAESILDTAADTWNYDIFLHLFLQEFLEVHQRVIGT